MNKWQSFKGVSAFLEIPDFILYAFIDSGSFRGDNAKDIEMSINMNSDGSIINVYAKATLTPGDVRITANIVPADVNAYRTKVVKQLDNLLKKR